MASFTIALKDVIDITEGDIGLDFYPLFDESYREPLNDKIIDHFYNREIGVETIDMFQLVMRRKMNEIMPYYNQLYESELLKVDPFITFKSDSGSEQTTENSNQSSATNDSSSEGKSRTVSSETPQTRLAGNEDYASAAQDSVSNSTAGGTASDNSSGTMNGINESHSSGFSGAMSDLLNKYRSTFINVDMMVLDELEPLFMQIWSTGDEFSTDAEKHMTRNYMPLDWWK